MRRKMRLVRNKFSNVLQWLCFKHGVVLSGVYESVLGKLLIHKLDLLLQFSKLLLLGFVLKLSLDCDLFNLEVLHEEIGFFKL